MPTFFYEAPSFTLRGLFRPEFDVLDGLPFYTTALISLAVALAVAVGLVLARARTRRLSPSPHYSREMRDQSQTVDIAHNYANGLFDEVFCNEISGPGVWWPRPISGGPMNYSG